VRLYRLVEDGELGFGGVEVVVQVAFLLFGHGMFVLVQPLADFRCDPLHMCGRLGFGELLVGGSVEVLREGTLDVGGCVDDGRSKLFVAVDD